MLKNILILFFIISFQILSAQNIEKAFHFLNEGKTEKADKIFDKAISQKKDLPAAEYGKVLILSRQKTANPQYSKIYRYLLNIDKSFDKIPQSKKVEYENFGLTRNSVDTMKNWVLQTEYHNAANSKKISKMNYFLTVYPGTIQAKKMKFFRDSLEYSRAEQANNVKDYNKFIENYPESEFLKIAKQRRDSIWKDEYNKAYRSLELRDIKLFDSKYPDYPFYDDSSKVFESRAIQAAELQMQLGYVSGNKGYYERFIKSAAPSEMAFQALLTLIQPSLEKANLQAAIDTVKKYKVYFKNNSKIDELLYLLNHPDKNIVSKPLNKKINTPAYEYMPVVTADGKTLYFCAEGRPGNIGKEDIFVSYLKNGDWSKPVVVRELSTAHQNEAPLSVSADGNTMLVFRNGDVFISHKTKSGWSELRPVKEINTKKYWEADAFITADGNAILFSSDRKGNIGSFHPINKRFHGDFVGNLDIYVIVKKKDGSWSKPINLGQTINTPYAERTPFLHPDMKTLYFSSDGHTGLGKMDVFKSTRLSDTSWTEWSKPENLGFGINSPRKEYGYKISTDGTKAYYAKFFNGQADIYSVTLPENKRPDKVAVVTGFVKDDAGNPLGANIIWENLENGQKLGQLNSDPQTGYYTITLPLGRNYGFYVSKQGYYPVSDNLDLRKSTDSLNVSKDFQMTGIDRIIRGEASITLNNIFFDYDKYELKKESYSELNRLVEFLKQHPQVKIEISGHTDSIGSVEYNMNLSQKRAETVKNYLIEKGCNPLQLTAKGYGATKPVADNSTEQGRKLNRRVEFKVVKSND